MILWFYAWRCLWVSRRIYRSLMAEEHGSRKHHLLDASLQLSQISTTRKTGPPDLELIMLLKQWLWFQAIRCVLEREGSSHHRDVPRADGCAGVQAGTTAPSPPQAHTFNSPSAVSYGAAYTPFFSGYGRERSGWSPSPLADVLCGFCSEIQAF